MNQILVTISLLIVATCVKAQGVEGDAMGPGTSAPLLASHCCIYAMFVMLCFVQHPDY